MDQMKNFEIQIILHKGDDIIPFRVGTLDAIRTIINKISFDTPPLFIYKNSVLLNALSFAFYGITEGSHIYTVPISQNKDGPPLTTDSASPRNNSNDNSLFRNLRTPSFPLPQIKKDFNAEREKFKKIFKKIHNDSAEEEESLDLVFKTYSDPNFARESAKIKDRFFQRVEGTIKCHRRLLKHFIQSSGNCFSYLEQKSKDKDKNKYEGDQNES